MWGINANGQLGLGNTTDYSSPKQVGALTTWAKATIGPSTSAIKTDGTLWTWGYNGVGSLALGNLTSYSSPKQVGNLTNWTSVSGSSLGYTQLAIALK
jgi:alpha-tubulin suppressor-like RCC1 family protein